MKADESNGKAYPWVSWVRVRLEVAFAAHV